MVDEAVTTRLLREEDLADADRIVRDSFGAHLGIEDVFGDVDYVHSRWRSAPEQALAATLDGELVGSNFLARWGSVGVFGPLSVDPDRWGQGIAQALLEPTVALFEEWGTTHQGLYTFADSTKHLMLYQRFGFWPAYLTTTFGTAVTPREPVVGTQRLSAGSSPEDLVDGCRAVTNGLYDGLDLTSEIDAVSRLGLGDTVIVEGHGGVAGFAVCHAGPGTEAGSDHTYVKFAAVRSGPDSAATFDRLLDGCEAFAHAVDCRTLVAGVNTARVDAYRAVLARGYQARNTGVVMQRGEDRGYNRPDRWVIDDWR